MERRRTGGSCDLVREHAFQEILLLKSEAPLAEANFPNLESPEQERQAEDVIGGETSCNLCHTQTKNKNQNSKQSVSL